MPGLYTVTIHPLLLANGQQKGHLEYLHFTATAGDHQERWTCVNTGTLSADFHSLFAEWGTGILERLRKGEKVKLPRPLELRKRAGLAAQGTTDMPASMTKFLIELLHGEEDTIEAIEKQIFDEQLTSEQRTSLLDLQTRYENLCEFIRKVIHEHE